MLVTFRSNAWSNITMFGDVAQTLLEMMGHSGTVPGAILAADIAPALARLEAALAALPDDRSRQIEPGAEDEDVAAPVGLRLRAYPLIQMLSAAARQGSDVMWEASRATD